MNHSRVPAVGELPTLERWLTGPRIAGLPAPAVAPKLSFEFFPPRTAALEAQLWVAVRRLERLRPDFVSVTHGAGGSTLARTETTVRRILAETTLRPAAHLTCAGLSRGAVDDIARRYWDLGVRHLVALRGDPPRDAAGRAFEPHGEGYRNATELVGGLRRVAPFEISVAAYPEVHPEATSAEDDLAHLRRKLDAGATRAITQLFFETEHFLRFLDRALAAGITAPIVPGILPVDGLKARRFIESCGATVPDWLISLFDGLEDDPDTRRLVGAVIAAEQVRLLQANGVDEFHFYTMNRPDLTFAVARILGVRGEPATATASAGPVTASAADPVPAASGTDPARADAPGP